MSKFIQSILFGLSYLFIYWTGKNGHPLICGLVLHNTCNLRCKHCDVVNRPAYSMTFDEVKSVINDFYESGGRCLYLEGGEPTIWKDNEYDYNDVIQYAKQKGYYSITLYTNGLKPIETIADMVFVSIDGTESTHNTLRGNHFEDIMHHVMQSNHPSIFVNYTINTKNYQDIETFCELIRPIPEIKGVFFYFHTPYYGYDELFLNTDQKNEIILQIIRLKKKYHILNSVPGLNAALTNNWKKKISICTVYEGGNFHKCCRINNNDNICKNCGYLSYAEIDQALKLKPGALINALKYF